jgi:hypothetical protein
MITAHPLAPTQVNVIAGLRLVVPELVGVITQFVHNGVPPLGTSWVNLNMLVITFVLLIIVKVSPNSVPAGIIAEAAVPVTLYMNNEPIDGVGA